MSVLHSCKQAPLSRLTRCAMGMFLLAGLSCGYDLPTPPDSGNPPSGDSRAVFMSARAEGEEWDSEFVTARNDDGYLVLEGTMWVDWEASLVIRLYMKAEVGVAQVIAPSSSFIGAQVKYIPIYTESQSWSASRVMGSGTFTVTSLSDTSATGTFSFTANALTPNSLPQNYRVTDGAFFVRF